MTDAFDLQTAIFHSKNVAAWPIATELQGVEFKDADPQGGVRPILSAMPWAGIIPTGWDGPITFAIWLGRQIGGVWHLACALEFYEGKFWTGAPLHKQYNDWLSVGKGFGELEGLPNPVPGERLAFMVTAGSQRLKDTSSQPGPKSVQQRSNVIVVPFQVNAVVLSEAGTQVPSPVPQLPPTSTGENTGGSTQVGPAFAELSAQVAALVAVDANQADQITALQTETATLRKAALDQNAVIGSLNTLVGVLAGEVSALKAVKVPTYAEINLFGRTIRVPLRS